MVGWIVRFGAACLLLGLLPTTVLAGMPTPVLTEWATMRISAISFFAVVLLVAALVVKLLWNSLAATVSILPPLTYFRSLALVLLWGFLFVFVLTMIAGARELMTPEAWGLQGITYKVVRKPAAEKPQQVAEAEGPSLAARTEQLEKVKLILWDWALKHKGQFPQSAEAFDHLADLPHVAGLPGVPYRFVPGRKAEGVPQLLAFEPAVFGPVRLALRTDGAITVVSSEQLAEQLEGLSGEEKRP